MSFLNLNVLKENSMDNNIKNVFDIIAIEETYFYSTLDYIRESNNEFNLYTKELYKSILESNNEQYIIHESFSSFFDKTKQLIKKFLDFIKSLFNRFLIILHRFVSSDKFILKNKDKYVDFKDDYKFDIKGYNYTFNDNIPVIEALAEFKKEFVGIDFDEMIKDKDPKSRSTYIDKKYGQLKKELGEYYFDKFRARVIGKSGDITITEFQEELSKVFRDDTTSKDIITITNEEVMKSLGRFENYKEYENKTKKTKEKIESDYKEIERLIERLYKNAQSSLDSVMLDINGEYDGGVTPDNLVSLDKTSINKLDLFIKTKVNQVIQMSNIHSLAFSSKLDAIAECMKQDKGILYKALSKIEKNKGIKESCEVEYLNEFNLFKKDPNKEAKKHLDYLKYLKTQGVSVQEYKSKILPKFIKYQKEAADKVKQFTDHVNFIGECDIYIPNMYKKRYDELIEAISDFSILKEKDYSMKRFLVVDWKFQNPTDDTSYMYKVKSIIESVIKNDNSFKIHMTDSAMFILCQEWIYDKNKIDKQIRELEQKVGDK